MGYVFRKRDIVLIIGVILIAVVIFLLGFVVGGKSGYFDRDQMIGDPRDYEHTEDINNNRETNSNESPDDLDNDTDDDLSKPPDSETDADDADGDKDGSHGDGSNDTNATDSDDDTDSLSSGETIDDTPSQISETYYIDRWVDLYTNIDDTESFSSIGPQYVEVLEYRDDWIRIATDSGDKWVNIGASTIRQSVLLDIPALNQRELGYPLGCEMVALTMLMNYVTEVSIHVLVAEMPRADHPDEGFRGEPSSSSRGWTIFPPALEAMMLNHVGSSYDMSGMQMSDLKAQLNNNKPVMVWVSGLGWAVHALCLTGYDNNGFYYNDPWTGAGNTFISYDDFYAIWNKPIVDSVLGLTYEPRKALSY